MHSPPIRRLLALCAAVACAAALQVAGAAPAAADTVGPITGVASGKCVDVPSASSASSASPSGIEIVNDWIYMAAVRGTRLWVMKITGNTTDTPRAFFNGSWGRLRTVVKTPDGGLWLTSTNNDMNGGTPTVLNNVIVRLRFAS